MASSRNKKAVLHLLLSKIAEGDRANHRAALEALVESIPPEGLGNEAGVLALLEKAPEALRGTYRPLWQDILVQSKLPQEDPDSVQASQEPAGTDKNPVAVRLVKPIEVEQELVKFLRWTKNRTHATSFGQFDAFVQKFLVNADEKAQGHHKELVANTRGLANECLHGARAYEILRAAAEAFLLHGCSAGGDDVKHYLEIQGKDYLKSILRNAFGNDYRSAKTPFDEGILRDHVGCLFPIELIWNYWLEEGMVVQTLNAISLRFQNIRGEDEGRDPLAEFEVDPLRPLSNLLWGYIQDERNRLSVRRRAYEYEHHYGLRLFGKVVRDLRPADSRSKFLEAFHYLLLRCSQFFREVRDLTKRPNGHPVLNALKELHVLLSFGAHNQFGDLPWQARVEMLVQMWLLGREEMRDFLGKRIMVPYEEPWMGRVDSMKHMQGWTDTSVTHFYRLARYGERILLSIRHVNWNAIEEERSALTWAQELEDDLHGYIHSYRAVTGIDLTNDQHDQGDDDPRFVLPSIHLRRRLAQRGRNAVREAGGR